MANDTSLLTQYICPGERHPISRSIHLARLAAAYSACRECPLRDDARHLASKAAEGEEVKRPPRRDLFVAEGVRGVYLNEITQSLGERMAAAFATALWEDSPLGGQNDGIDRGARHARPTVVVGYDERSSSPSVSSSVVAGLRRTGCHVIDVGLATKPCFWFAVDHLHAAGGAFVTGSGCEPSWTGIDFVGPAARPLSLSAGLDRIREGMHGALNRPSRHAGTQRAFQVAALYENSLNKHLENLRPLVVACASPSPLVRQTVERVFQPLPAQLVAVDLPVRLRNPVHRRDADVLRLSTAVRQSKTDFGILIDDDGQRCGFVDERGRHVSPQAIARFIVPPMLARSSGATILLEPGASCEMRPIVEALGGRCEPCPKPFEKTADAMREKSALYAGGDSGRHWFVDRFPTSDAILILIKVLVVLSQANASFSDLAAG